MARAGLFLTLGSIFLLLSCSPKHDESNQSSMKTTSNNVLSIIRPVLLLDINGLHTLIQERHGKALLLNVWATWCQPCVEEFPDIVQLAQEDTTLQIVGISVDYPDEIQSKVMPFLTKMKVPFQVYVAKSDKQEDFITVIDPDWNGAVPATYLYDSKGRKRSSWIGERSLKEFQKAVRDLM